RTRAPCTSTPAVCNRVSYPFTCVTRSVHARTSGDDREPFHPAHHCSSDRRARPRRGDARRGGRRGLCGGDPDRTGPGLGTPGELLLRLGIWLRLRELWLPQLPDRSRPE